jgi:hypothetical protein
MDTPVTLGNVETVCTGIGDGKNDPRWKTYPIRVEFADGAAHDIAGAHVVLSDVAGRTAAELDCSGSWVLFKMPRGPTASRRASAPRARRRNSRPRPQGRCAWCCASRRSPEGNFPPSLFVPFQAQPRGEG